MIKTKRLELRQWEESDRDNLARLNASAEASTLDTIVSNASEGIEAALEDMALFLGVDPDSVLYRLNDNFWESSLSSQDLMAVTAARQAGIFDEREALHMIRTGALRLNADRSDDDILQGVAESLVDEPIDAGCEFNSHTL